MGEDGTEGASALSQMGGKVIVESPRTAVIDGMPLSVIRRGVPAEEEMVERMAERIINFTYLVK